MHFVSRIDSVDVVIQTTKYLGIPRDDVGGIMAIIGVIVLLYLWWRESRNKNKNKK